MLILIVVFYILPVYFVFFHYKWIPSTRMWKILLPLPSVVALRMAWFALGRVTPMSHDAYVQVLVEDDARVAQGDPLFRIDAEPYQNRVDQVRVMFFEERQNEPSGAGPRVL